VSIATGAVESITDGAQAIVAFSATADASRIATTISTPTNIGDLALIGAAGARAPAAARPHAAKPAFITHVNDDLFKQIAQSEPEEVWYTRFDGRRIQGWILKSPDFDAARRYPMNRSAVAWSVLHRARDCAQSCVTA